MSRPDWSLLLYSVSESFKVLTLDYYCLYHIHILIFYSSFYISTWYLGQVHCVAYLCSGVVLGWKPEKSSKFDPSLLPKKLTDFHGDEAKKIKMTNSKKLSFSIPPILNIFCEHFRDWSLGEQVKLKRRALIWLNLYGRQAVRRKV